VAATAGGKLPPAVVAVPKPARGLFRLAHRRTAYARSTPAGITVKAAKRTSCLADAEARYAVAVTATA
jgi:hypothetical protein